MDTLGIIISLLALGIGAVVGYLFAQVRSSASEADARAEQAKQRRNATPRCGCRRS